MQTMSTTGISDVVGKYQRFRILCVGKSGAGKSSLINSVFKIKDAKVSDWKAGEADIRQEFSSKENPLFVAHDSKGYEPADATTFKIVHNFIHERCNIEQTPNPRDQLHALWLCIETPRAGARILEDGDEKTLKLAHELKLPVVVVFTQYDKLVRSKAMELKEELQNSSIAPNDLKERSKQEAEAVYRTCIELLERLGAQTPSHLNVSVKRGYEDSIVSLVKLTSGIVQERFGELWLLWATAQRASLPLKIDACIENGMNHYWTALAGTIPGLGKTLLNKCLGQVHQDVVTCWNFNDEQKILNQNEYKQLILYIAQNVQLEDQARNSSSWPDLKKVSEFVSLVKTATEVTAAAAVIVPPVAILGLTYVCVQCLSKYVQDNLSGAQRLMIAYSIDLILVLGELFDITLRPDLAGTITWDAAFAAFEVYQGSDNRTRDLHDEICDLVKRHQGVDRLRSGVKELVEKYRKTA